MAGDAPQFAVAARHRRGNAAARRGAEFGLDAEGVDQRAVADDVLGDAAARAVEHTDPRQAVKEQIGHDEDQRRRRFAACDGLDDLQRRRQVGTAAADFGGRGQADQSGIMQTIEILDGYAPARIDFGGCRGKGLGQLSECRVETRRCSVEDDDGAHPAASRGATTRS